MKKKILSALLCLTLLVPLSSLASCGEGGEGDSVTLKWATPFFGQKDESKVLEAFNKKLGEIMPGVKLEFMDFNPEKWTQQMSSKEPIDIAWTGYSLNMDAEIQNRSYLALNDYISKESTPNLWKEWKEEFPEEYDTAVVDDKLYAIPNEQPIVSESPILKIPESLYEYFDIDAFRAAADASPYSTKALYDVLDKYFKKIHDAGLTDSDTVSKGIDIKNIANYLMMRGYSSIGNTGVCYKIFDDGKLNLDASAKSDEFKLFCEYAVKWYKAGYIAKDVLLDTGATGSRLSPLTVHINGMWYNLNDKERGVLEVYDTDGYLEQYYVNVNPEDGRYLYKGDVKIGGESTYLAVPFTAKHPEEAVKLLDLLRSPVGTEGNELFNLLVYGIEGEHYTIEDDDLAIGNGYSLQASRDNLYGKPHWVIGNVYLTYRTPNIQKGQAEYAKTVYREKMNKAHKTPLYGFKFDSSKVQTQIGNMSAATEEYRNRLICGVDGDNWKTTYDQFIARLETAGLDKVIAEIKSQAEIN